MTRALPPLTQDAFTHLLSNGDKKEIQDFMVEHGAELSKTQITRILSRNDLVWTQLLVTVCPRERLENATALACAARYGRLRALDVLMTVSDWHASDDFDSQAHLAFRMANMNGQWASVIRMAQQISPLAAFNEQTMQERMIHRAPVEVFDAVLAHKPDNDWLANMLSALCAEARQFDPQLVKFKRVLNHIITQVTPRPSFLINVTTQRMRVAVENRQEELADALWPHVDTQLVVQYFRQRHQWSLLDRVAMRLPIPKRLALQAECPNVMAHTEAWLQAHQRQARSMTEAEFASSRRLRSKP